MKLCGPAHPPAALPWHLNLSTQSSSALGPVWPSLAASSPALSPLSCLGLVPPSLGASRPPSHLQSNACAVLLPLVGGQWGTPSASGGWRRIGESGGATCSHPHPPGHRWSRLLWVPPHFRPDSGATPRHAHAGSLHHYTVITYPTSRPLAYYLFITMIIKQSPTNLSFKVIYISN